MLCLAIASACGAQDAKKTQKKASNPSRTEVINKKTVVDKKVVKAPKQPASKTAATPKNRTSAEAKATPKGSKGNVKKNGKPQKSDNGKAQKAKNNTRNAKPRKKQPAKKAASRYIALKTNLPFDALAMQNLALEVQIHKHITIDFPVMWSISDIEREHAVRGIAFQPEGRWWLKEAGTGHFFGLHTHVAWFNVKWNDTRYQTAKRPLAGVGISYGYKLPLSAHWGAEFNIGAGYANMKYDTFYNIENGARLDTRIRHYWGITRAGLSLVYRF